LGHYIKHVVVIIQENRSFENFFAGWPGADAPTSGECHNKWTGKTTTIKLNAIDWSGTHTDLPHAYTSSWLDFDTQKGVLKMDGFCNPLINPGQPAGLKPYTYVKHSLIAPYRAIAQQYVLADHMFPSEASGSFTGHLALVAGDTSLSKDTAVALVPTQAPWGCDAPAGTTVELLTSAHRFITPGPFPCFTQIRSMADDLDAHNVSWKYYTPSIALPSGIWNPFDAIKTVRYSSDWQNNVVSPETTILTDAGSGNLPDVAWVVPSYTDSDHPPGSTFGPSWVASVINAIGEGPDWSSTAVVIVWDDWGGFYDNVPPPQLDYRGLGIRVPCLIVSPYARAGYVSHTQYEFGSILKFIEQTFRLPPLGPTSQGYTDTRAASIVDSFDFTQKPRTFYPISAPVSASYFFHLPPSDTPPDDE
ncbi:MAG: hypothetical protein JO092_10410, partial [Candidatus Eremiobacteraeota bacterium]|nr:hypothetical protein [Candidatus Eremiobacteraeota bacterium]